jgi:hypothetical protein
MIKTQCLSSFSTLNSILQWIPKTPSPESYSLSLSLFFPLQCLPGEVYEKAEQLKDGLQKGLKAGGQVGSELARTCLCKNWQDYYPLSTRPSTKQESPIYIVPSQQLNLRLHR